MILRLPLLILCTCGGLVLGTGLLHAAPSEVFSIEQCLPNIETSFEDLDVRDDANQQIKNAAAVNELKEIFQSGLFSLLMQPELPAVAQALSVIEKELNLAAHSFVRQLPVLPQLLFAVLSFSRSWEKALARLVALPGVFLLVVALSFAAFLPMPPVATKPLVAFRC